LPGKTPASAADQAAQMPAARDPVREPISKELVKVLKPHTLVTMGALHAQMAEELARSPEERQQLFRQAAHAYQTALKQDASYVPAYMAMGQLSEKLGDPQKAITAYENALKHAPNNPTIWYTLGMCLNRGKQWEAAAERLRKAAELEPGNRQIVSACALTLARVGKHDECLSWLRKVSTPAEAHYSLARMLHHMEDYDHCKQHLELALQNEPTHTGAQQLVQSLTAPAAEPLPGTGAMHAN